MGHMGQAEPQGRGTARDGELGQQQLPGLPEGPRGSDGNRRDVQSGAELGHRRPAELLEHV